MKPTCRAHKKHWSDQRASRSSKLIYLWLSQSSPFSQCFASKLASSIPQDPPVFIMSDSKTIPSASVNYNAFCIETIGRKEG